MFGTWNEFSWSGERLERRTFHLACAARALSPEASDAEISAMALDIARGARQLLTMRGRQGPRRGPALNELGIIPDGALLIRDGVLVEVGTARRVENLAQARGELERAARLRGATASLREVIGVPLTPSEIGDHERRLSELKPPLERLAGDLRATGATLDELHRR